MSAIAAKIFGKRKVERAHLLQEVHDQPRLSYFDLDRMLDREEHELTHENARRRHAHPTEPKTTTSTSATEPVSSSSSTLWSPFDQDAPAPPSDRPATESDGSRSSSDCSSSDDDFDTEFEGKHEEELLVELDESNQDDIHSIHEAEDHLVRDIDSIIHLDIKEEQLARMSKLLEVNCLHRGGIEEAKGKRWMVAIDGTPASLRAWEGVLKMMQPEDHLMVVTVRDKNLPRRFALSPAEEIQLQFELWRSARHILKPFMKQLAHMKRPEQYTVVIPNSWDARRSLCGMAKRYRIDAMCVGRHSRGEHNRHHWHLRSLHSYTSKHAPCQVIVF